MTGAQIAFMSEYRQPEGLLDRAKRRRTEALGRRMACIIQTVGDGEGVVEHVFSGMPKLGDLIARTGPNVSVIAVRMEPIVERRRMSAAIAAQ